MMEDLTVVLPAYNEEQAIGLVIDDVRLFAPGSKILVVDNNSSDNTKQISLEKGVTLIDEPRQGKGNAIQTALTHIGTPYMVMVNSDYTYPLDYIRLVYGLLAMEHYDVVIGCRELKERGSMSTINSIGNSLLSLLASVLYWHRVYDVCTGMWGFRKDALDRFNITSEGFTLEADLFINSVKNNCKIVQIPIGYRCRVGKAKLKVLDGFRIAWFLTKRRMVWPKV